MSDTPHQRRSAWPLIVCFAVLAVSVAGLAYWAWRQQAQSMQRQAERSLAAVGELKADQITAWLKKRQGDAEMIRGDPLLPAAVEDMLAGRDVAKATARVQAFLDSFQRSYDYQDVVMTSPNGARRTPLRIPWAVKSRHSRRGPRPRVAWRHPTSTWTPRGKLASGWRRRS